MAKTAINKLCHQKKQRLPFVFILSPWEESALTLGSPVARLGLATASRPRKLARHRSGVRFSAQNKEVYFEPMGRIELPYTVYDTVALPLSYMGIS